MTTPGVADRPLTAAELCALRACVTDVLVQARHYPYRATNGVGFLVGVPPTGSHVLLIAVSGGARLAGPPEALDPLLDAWQAALTQAGLLADHHRRGGQPIGLIVRPRVQLTPDQLYAAVNARRRELGYTWAEVAGQAGLSQPQLTRLRGGAIARGARGPIEAWLEAHRHTAPLPPPPTTRPRKARTHHGGPGPTHSTLQRTP